MADELVVSITKRFGSGASVTADLQVSMRPGSIVVLFGPSGSGKTTLVRAVAGLERPDAGTIRFAGETWFDAGSSTFVGPERRRVGYVFQEAALFPHLTVRANIEYGVNTRDAAAVARAGELVDMLALPDLADRYPRQLSGGQAERVALARALASSPRLLLLDEPFAALDTPARMELRRLLRASVERLGIAAVLVTHDRTEAIALGDLMAVLACGRVRQVGSVLDVVRRPADFVVARSVGVESVVPARIVGEADDLVELRIGPATLRAVAAEWKHDEKDVFACIRAEDVTLERTATRNASARNHLSARILNMESDGPLERVTLDCGFPLAALITRQAREEMALAEGETVVAVVKATAVHLVPKM